MIRKAIREMSHYKPPLEGRSQSGFLLLDFNERTTPVSPKIKQALVDYLNQDRLHLYPEYGDFLCELSDYIGTDQGQVMITNGSDQGIDIIYRTVSEPGDEAIVPAPTFAMLVHSAEVNGLRLFRPAYTDDYQYPLNEVLSLITEKTKVIVVCNPNSPTGTLLEPENIVRLAKAAPHAAILVDECYYEYSQTTVRDYINACSNIFITRTFSKTWGLASLRLGYIISCAENIENLLKVRGPYDMNKLAIVAASAALDDSSFMDAYVKEVIDVSRPMLSAFLEKRGIRFWPSKSNFILLYPPNAEQMVKGLREQGILVRPQRGPKIEGTVRITIGTSEDTRRLIAALDSLLA